MYYYVYRNGSVCQRQWPDDSSDYKEISSSEYEELKALQEQNAVDLSRFVDKHQGQDIHIFGCGPSLNDFAAKQDWSGKVTIGTNYSIVSIPDPTYWVMVDDYFKDTPAMKAIQEWAKETGVTRFVSRSMLFHGYRPGNGTFLLNHAREPGSSNIATGVFWRASVVQAAIDLARFMQAKRIILWGIDYHDKTHNYTEQIADPTDGKGSWDMFKLRDQFKALQEQCFRYELYIDPQNPEKTLKRSIRIPILNANPSSALDVFPKVDPEEILDLPRQVSEVDVEGEPLVTECSSEDMEQVDSPQDSPRSIEFDLDSCNLVIRHSGNGMMVVPFDDLKLYPELQFLKQYIKRMDGLGIWEGKEPESKKDKKAKPAPKPEKKEPDDEADLAALVGDSKPDSQITEDDLLG